MAVESKPLHIPSTADALPKRWQWGRLDDVCSGVFDCPHSTPVLTNEGAFVVRSQDVRSGIFRMEGAARVSDETYRERIARAEPRHGDLVYSREGTYFGIAAELPPDVRVCLGQRMVLLRPNDNKANFRFLRYWLNSPVMAGHIHGYRDGTVAERLNMPIIRALPVALPPLREQRAIASVLGSLDDKIELNRRMNETLEALAQSLFKSWFVDAAQSALPKGWREGKVSDLATLSRDGLNPGEFPDETFDHYSLPAFDEGRTPKPESGDTIMSNKFIVPPNCVMVSKLNPRIPRIWLPDLRGQNRAVCSTEFLVATPKPGISREFLYCLFINESFVSMFTTMVTGTSGSHQRVRPESLLNMDTPLPPAPLIQKFTDTVAPMLKRISQNIHESRTLAALRDALLPKLLSGELRVPKSIQGKL